MKASVFMTAAFLALLPAAGVAQTQPASPIQIDYCHVAYSTGLLFTKSADGIQIKFTNEGDKTATLIRFGVTLSGNDASIRDVGEFAPNITVDHRFRDFMGSGMRFMFSHEDQPKCRVTFIKFADGTLWQASESDAAAPAPSPSPAASATP